MTTTRTAPANTNARVHICPAALLLLAASAVALPRLASGGVIVQQVEAGIAAGSPTYAPVSFNGSATATSAAYPSIIFNAQYATVGTLSSHAQVVADNFFGAGYWGAGHVSQVYNHSAVAYDSLGRRFDLPFYFHVLNVQFDGLGNSLAVGPVPDVLARDQLGDAVPVRVTNHSYVLQFTKRDASNNVVNDDAANLQLLRRADFLINRDNVVWVAGAVNGTAFSGGANGATTMGWQVRNGIAVRGDAGQTPFDPNLGFAGRKHTDVWGSKLASFMTGEVSGSAAALIDAAGANTAMADARVIKSVIMTGANKTIQPANFHFNTPWTPTTANNLDGDSGAGKFDHPAALAILSAGQRTYSSLAAGSSTVPAGATPSTVTQGWGLGAATAGEGRVVLVRFDSPVSTLAATLNWNVTSQATGGNINTSDASVLFPDLAFSLRPVTWNGSQYVLGSALADNAARDFNSNATGVSNDNVEHLFQLSGLLSPGTYAFVIDAAGSSLSTTAAMSYRAGVLAGTTAANTTYTAAADSAYSAPANWSGGIAPSGTSATAIFNSPAVASRSVSLDAPVTLGTLSFSGSTQYTLAATGGNGLTLSNGAFGPASLSATAGAHSITAPLTLAGATNVFVSPGASLALDTVANGGALALTGGGAAALSTSLTGSGSVEVAAGSRLTLTAQAQTTGNRVVLNQSALTIGGAAGSRGVLEVTGTTPTQNANLLVTGALNIANDGAALGSRTYLGFLDLGANDLIVKSASAGAYSTTLANVTDMVRTWIRSAGGLPGNTGLGSTLAVTANPFTTLAVVGNNVAGSTFAAAFDGQTVTTTDVLVKYTYIGDLDLDGDVDNADFARLSLGLQGSGGGWSFGDVNYDGLINGFDFHAITDAFRGQGLPLGNSLTGGGGAGASVPEPAGMATFSLAAAAALLRRARRA